MTKLAFKVHSDRKCIIMVVGIRERKGREGTAQKSPVDF